MQFCPRPGKGLLQRVEMIAECPQVLQGLGNIPFFVFVFFVKERYTAIGLHIVLNSKSGEENTAFSKQRKLKLNHLSSLSVRHSLG